MADVEAMEEVIRTAADDPRDAPAAQEVQEDLLVVYQGLREIYGDDIDLLGRPTEPDVDRAKICELSASFYDRVLELPEGSPGRIIRYLFSDNE